MLYPTHSGEPGIIKTRSGKLHFNSDRCHTTHTIRGPLLRHISGIDSIATLGILDYIVSALRTVVNRYALAWPITSELTHRIDIKMATPSGQPDVKTVQHITIVI